LKKRASAASLPVRRQFLTKRDGTDQGLPALLPYEPDGSLFEHNRSLMN
jgi:hypothetical protein